MKSDKINVREAAKLLLENDFITILCHANPDGDTLGSAFALCGALQKLGKKARVLCPDEISPRFLYLKDGINENGFGDGEERFIVTVDVADIDLLGDLRSKYEGKVTLAIDHHSSNKEFAEKLLLESAAANAEIIFYLIKELGAALDKHIAACLYTGITTDTGCFRFSNTTRDSHIITAEIMKQDFDIAGLNYLLFEMKSKQRLELECKAINEVEYYFNGKCAIIVLDGESLLNVDGEDINGISALARRIEGVEVGITFKEKEKDVWKISLRSNKHIDCRGICQTFGGGGHLRAAGCKLTGTLSDCKAKLLEEIEKHMH